MHRILTLLVMLLPLFSMARDWSPIGFCGPCLGPYPWKEGMEPKEQPCVNGLTATFLIGGYGEVNGAVLNVGILGLGLNEHMHYGEGRVNGLALGLLMHFNGVQRGVSIVPINLSTEMQGFSFGLVNCTGSLAGVQCGLFNALPKDDSVLQLKGSACGLQLGLFNFLEEPGRVLQVGLWNVVKGSAHPMLPVVNWQW